MDGVQRARLIPTSGINGKNEAEQRATSALLAVVSIVPDFADALLRPLGSFRASTASIECFTEVEVKLPSGKVRPDGLIVANYGKRQWSALVEVKTGTANLKAEQLNAYLEAAREIEADIVISISNEIGIAGTHPTEGLKVRSNSRIKVHHYSWTEILSDAVRCKVHAGVDDPEQAWILGELIRYLEHPASGVASIDDMGTSWVDIRDGARQGTLTSRSEGIDEVATKWDEVIRHLALHLSAETGAEVSQVLSRAHRDPRERLKALQRTLTDSGTLDAVIRIPNSAADLDVEADLRARQISVSATVLAPTDKGGKGSVGWLLRQLRGAPDDLLVEVYEKNARTPLSGSLAGLLQDPTGVIPSDRGDVHKFSLVLKREAGANRRAGGRSPGFIDSINSTVETFYEKVMQNISAWQPPTPKVVRRPSDHDDHRRSSEDDRVSADLRHSDDPVEQSVDLREAGRSTLA